jgi:hypothetical protein
MEILNHGTIAVQENDRRPIAALDVVEPRSLQIEEAALWGMLSLRSLPTTMGSQSHAAQKGRGCDQHTSKACGHSAACTDMACRACNTTSHIVFGRRLVHRRPPGGVWKQFRGKECPADPSPDEQPARACCFSQYANKSGAAS